MSEHVAEFVERHKSSAVPRLRELLHEFLNGQLKLRSLSEDASSSELAQTYSVRSSTAARNGREDLSNEMQALSEQCKANAGNFCAIWVFEGSSSSYAVFELLPSRVMAGCFKFEGPIGGSAENAA
jgi:hypothetical protein